MKRNLKKMFAQKAGTLMIDEELQNDELMIKLRKWKQAKKKLEAEKLDAEIQQAQPDMQDNEIKVMILKLIQTEKLIKQIYKKKKKDLLKKPKRRDGRKRTDKRAGEDVSQSGHRSAMRSRLGPNASVRVADDTASASGAGARKVRKSVDFGGGDNRSDVSGPSRGAGSGLSRPELQIGGLSDHSGQ